MYPWTIVAAAAIIAWLVKIIFETLLRTLFIKTKTEADDQIVKSLKNPVFWSVFIAGGCLFLKTQEIQTDFLISILNILKSFAVLIWAKEISTIISVLIHELGKRESVEGKHADVIPFMKSFSGLILFFAVLTILFKVWGIDVTPILASAGIAGAALAFAAKDTVSNLFGGISVFFDKPYMIGDYVIIDDKYRGEVIEIGIRSTRIKTRDDVLLTVPNSVLVTKAVVNETGLDGQLRVRLPIGVIQGTDLEKAEEIIVKILDSHKEILSIPAPRIRYRSFGDYTVDLEALFVIKDPANRGRITHEVIKKLDKGLRKEGIKLPPPQMEVSLHNG